MLRTGHWIVMGIMVYYLSPVGSTLQTLMMRVVIRIAIPIGSVGIEELNSTGCRGGLSQSCQCG